MKKIIGILGSTIAIAFLPTAAMASPISTRGVAMMACSQMGFYLMKPDYYGQTRGGLDIWICVESGEIARRMFSIRNPGPYPVMVCNPMQCKVVDETY